MGDTDSPNLYAFVGWGPSMYTDPLGLCIGPLEPLTCGEALESFNPLTSGFWKRTGGFLKGEVKGVAKAPVEAVKGVVYMVENPRETVEGLYYVATNLPTVAEQAVDAYVMASTEEQGEVVGMMLAGIAAGGATKTAEVQKVARLARMGRTVDAVDTRSTRVLVQEGKFDYLFGRATGRQHNLARTNQNALQMKRLGVPDTPEGHDLLRAHFDEVAKSETNIVDQFTTKHGQFEVRESLFDGPSGQFSKFETTFEVLPNGERRLVTVIPKGGQ